MNTKKQPFIIKRLYSYLRSNEMFYQDDVVPMKTYCGTCINRLQALSNWIRILPATEIIAHKRIVQLNQLVANISCTRITNRINWLIFNCEDKESYLLCSPQADYCWKACHFTPYVRNPKCLNGSWDEELFSTKTEKALTKVQTAVKGTCNYHNLYCIETKLFSRAVYC